MKIIKAEMNVSTGYVGSMVKEIVEVEVEDDASKEEIEAEVEEYFKEWLWGNIDSGWSIIE